MEKDTRSDKGNLPFPGKYGPDVVLLLGSSDPAQFSRRSLSPDPRRKSASDSRTKGSANASTEDDDRGSPRHRVPDLSEPNLAVTQGFTGGRKYEEVKKRKRAARVKYKLSFDSDPIWQGNPPSQLRRTSRDSSTSKGNTLRTGRPRTNQPRKLTGSAVPRATASVVHSRRSRRALGKKEAPFASLPETPRGKRAAATLTSMASTDGISEPQRVIPLQKKPPVQSKQDTQVRRITARYPVPLKVAPSAGRIAFSSGTKLPEGFKGPKATAPSFFIYADSGLKKDQRELSMRPFAMKPITAPVQSNQRPDRMTALTPRNPNARVLSLGERGADKRSGEEQNTTLVPRELGPGEFQRDREEEAKPALTEPSDWPDYAEIMRAKVATM